MFFSGALMLVVRDELNAMILGSIIASATLVALAPITTPTPEPLALHRAACPSSEVTHWGVVRGRKLLISGGVIARAGLLSATLGFDVLGGINTGNPGRPFELKFDDPSEARRTLKLSNTMTGVGVVGASLLIFATLDSDDRSVTPPCGVDSGALAHEEPCCRQPGVR